MQLQADGEHPTLEPIANDCAGVPPVPAFNDDSEHQSNAVAGVDACAEDSNSSPLLAGAPSLLASLALLSYCPSCHKQNIAKCRRNLSPERRDLNAKLASCQLGESQLLTASVGAHRG